MYSCGAEAGLTLWRPGNTSAKNASHVYVETEYEETLAHEACFGKGRARWNMEYREVLGKRLLFAHSFLTDVFKVFKVKANSYLNSI